jgi:hypothetical protein
MHKVTCVFNDGRSAHTTVSTHDDMIAWIAQQRAPGNPPVQVSVDGIPVGPEHLRALLAEVKAARKAMVRESLRPQVSALHDTLAAGLPALMTRTLPQGEVPPQQSIERKIRIASRTGFIFGGLGVFLWLWDIVSGSQGSGDRMLVSSVITLALAYGVSKHSRTCAIVLFSLPLLGMLFLLNGGKELLSYAGIIFAVYLVTLAVCYGMGVVGTIRYHWGKKDRTPGDSVPARHSEYEHPVLAESTRQLWAEVRPLLTAVDRQRVHAVAHTGRRLLASFHLERLIQGLCVLLLVAGVGLLCLTTGGLLNKTLPQDCLRYQNNPNWGIIYARLSCHKRAHLALGNPGPVAGVTLVGLGALGLVVAYAKKGNQ